MEISFPSTLLLTLALLLLAPLPEARKLGGSYDDEHLRLPSDGAVPSELEVLHGVSRPGGRAPPAPKPGYPPRPVLGPHEGGGSSFGAVSNRQQLAPPPPTGSTPPQYRRTGALAPQPADVFNVLRAFSDAIVRHVINA